MIYFDRRESERVARGPATLPASDPNSPANPTTWYAPTVAFTHCIEVRLGGSFFVLWA
jgi:hypothetical protein